MGKASKYKQLEGQIIETKHGLVEVLQYFREPKVSKTGRKYSVGKLVITNDENTITVSLDSWNKQSFGKRLLGKVVKQVKKKVKEIKQQAQEVLLPCTEVDSGFGADFLRLSSCYNSKTLKKLYRTLSKQAHPDHGGDAKLFNVINFIYRQRKYAVDTMVESFNEFNEWDELNFTEEVDFFIDTANWDKIFAEGWA